jgi:hypothetical protein
MLRSTIRESNEVRAIVVRLASCHQMDGSRGERWVRLPTFDGKFKSFVIWWIRCRVFATVCQFIGAVKPVHEAHLPPTEDVTRYIYLGLSKWSECSVCVTMSPLLYGSLSRIRLTVVHDT